MMRRAVTPSRGDPEGGSIPVVSSLHRRATASPFLTFGLIVLGVVALLVYTQSGLGGYGGDKEARSRNGGVSCTPEILRALPILKKVYGDKMNKVLHVGPDTCTVVTKLLEEKDIEAWGVEPYDLEDADSNCKSLVRKGIVRVADIKFPLPYRPESFSLVIVSDALDYLSPKYLNKTLVDLARVSENALVIFAGYPSKQKAKVSELSKFGKPAKMRSPSWWIRFFFQSRLLELEGATKKFEQTAKKRSYNPNCQVFHLSPDFSDS